MLNNGCDGDEKDRIPFLENEIARLQDLCRNNFAVIAELKKENQKLNEIQNELKETTSDLAYSLAEYPWWAESENDERKTHTLNAMKVLLTYTKNIQYILQLPIFFDPMEQLKSSGLSQDQARRYLKSRYLGKGKKSFKCRKCSKEFSSNEKRQKHIQIHKGKKLYCKECCKYIPSFKAFRAHIQSHEFMNQMMAFPTLSFPQQKIDPAVAVIDLEIEDKATAKSILKNGDVEKLIEIEINGGGENNNLCKVNN